MCGISSNPSCSNELCPVNMFKSLNNIQQKLRHMLTFVTNAYSVLVPPSWVGNPYAFGIVYLVRPSGFCPCSDFLTSYFGIYPVECPRSALGMRAVMTSCSPCGQVAPNSTALNRWHRAWARGLDIPARCLGCKPSIPEQNFLEQRPAGLDKCFLGRALFQVRWWVSWHLPFHPRILPKWHYYAQEHWCNAPLLHPCWWLWHVGWAIFPYVGKCGK